MQCCSGAPPPPGGAKHHVTSPVSSALLRKFLLWFDEYVSLFVQNLNLNSSNTCEHDFSLMTLCESAVLSNWVWRISFRKVTPIILHVSWAVDQTPPPPFCWHVIDHPPLPQRKCGWCSQPFLLNYEGGAPTLTSGQRWHLHPAVSLQSSSEASADGSGFTPQCCVRSQSGNPWKKNLRLQKYDAVEKRSRTWLWPLTFVTAATEQQRKRQDRWSISAATRRCFRFFPQLNYESKYVLRDMSTGFNFLLTQWQNICLCVW